LLQSLRCVIWVYLRVLPFPPPPLLRPQSKLLGSRRLKQATKILLTTPLDQKRLMGSKRLKEARLILFNKAAQVYHLYLYT